MHSERVPVKAANNVPKVLNTVVSRFPCAYVTATAIVRGSGGLALIRYAAYQDRVPEAVLSSGYSASDGNNERHLYLGQKLEYLPGIEFPVKAEHLDREAEFSDPVETLGDNQPSRFPDTPARQRHLSVPGGHVEVT